MEVFHCLPRELLARATLDDLRELEAHYYLKHEERKAEQAARELEQQHQTALQASQQATRSTRRR